MQSPTRFPTLVRLGAALSGEKGRGSGFASPALWILLALALTTINCGDQTSTPAAARVSSDMHFVDVAEDLGIDHTHHQPILDSKLSNIMSWMASVGAAVATADYDGDGDMDLFFTDSRKGESNHLYRNDSGKFVDVAAEAGLAIANDHRGTSMDAAWGDVDNDGDPDLYLVRWGNDSLYLNEGNGTFTEVTTERFQQRDGSPGTDWANGNAVLFFDYDRDGLLDIYVGNYFSEVDLWDLEDTLIMHDDFEVARNGGKNYLYKQSADGTFEELAGSLGVDDPGWTLSVGSADLDGDGWMDLYCADDFGPDQIFLSRPGGRFVNATEVAIGYDTKKGMNADFGDVNNDGRLDIYVTNITTAEYLEEGNMLWLNQGVGDDGLPRFVDISLESGTYDGGWGWGAKFFDYDLDGDVDIVAANGFISAGEGSYWYDLASWTVLGQDASDASLWPAIGDRSFSGYEKERLWRNNGMQSFTEVATAEGLATDRDGRGIATVDIDDDGDLDLVIANQNQAPHVFLNRAIDPSKEGQSPHWLGLRLETDPRSNVARDAIGTRVTLKTGGTIQVRQRDGGNSFSAQSDPRLHFGLGDQEVVKVMEVRWPDGGLQYLENIDADQWLTVRQDVTAYAAEPRWELEKPTHIASTQSDEADPAALGATEDPVIVAAELAEMESRLRNGFDRALASQYRGRASATNFHEQASEFLKEQAEISEDPNWSIELSLAYVDQIPACGGLAAIVCKGTRAKQGIDVLDAVIEAHPDSWLAIYSRGMNHLHWPRALRHSAAAAEDLERCLALHEGDNIRAFDLRAWVALGQAYAKDGRYDEAREAWGRGLKRFPNAEQLKSLMAIEDNDVLLDTVEEARSLEKPADTDVSFYDEAL